MTYSAAALAAGGNSNGCGFAESDGAKDIVEGDRGAGGPHAAGTGGTSSLNL